MISYCFLFTIHTTFRIFSANVVWKYIVTSSWNRILSRNIVFQFYTFINSNPVVPFSHWKYRVCISKKFQITYSTSNLVTSTMRWSRSVRSWFETVNFSVCASVPRIPRKIKSMTRPVVTFVLNNFRHWMINSLECWVPFYLFFPTIIAGLKMKD